jgi:hypothetical protein
MRLDATTTTTTTNNNNNTAGTKTVTYFSCSGYHFAEEM